MTTIAGPLANADRIGEVDIIRGFALFGVLWINLVAQSHTLAPAGTFDGLPTAAWDAVISPAASILVTGKAMALFSLLFGYGFAMIINRLESKGVIATRIFMRRTGILLIFGLVHILFVWIGDILHVYALMGFILLLTRRWSDKWLLAAGLALALGSTGIVEGVLLAYDSSYSWVEIYVAGAERRFSVMLANDYWAYVAELWRAATQEMWGTPDYIPYALNTLGRFMIGAWIYRKGWLQDIASNVTIFKKAVWLLPVGLVASVGVYLLANTNDLAAYILKPIAVLVQAVGIGSALVLLCQTSQMKNHLRGLAAVGQMALTNYLCQSLAYIVILYGFGFGLLEWLSPTLCLVLAVGIFSVQIVFSMWWLRLFRYGPMEWLWRTLTYGQRQPFRYLIVSRR